MSICKKCQKNLSDAKYIIYKNTIYKSCPKCSKILGEHCYYRMPDEFGVTPKRITADNPMGIQSYCQKCRGNYIGPHQGALSCAFLLDSGGTIINNTRSIPELIEKIQNEELENYGGKIPEELEVSVADTLSEGQKTTITVNAYERNEKARKRCIEYYKRLNNGVVKCEICGFEFGKIYGEQFKEKIHIHHIKEISSIGREYQIDPEHDLLPVCPNCHLIIHSKIPAYLPDEMRDMLSQ